MTAIKPRDIVPLIKPIELDMLVASSTNPRKDFDKEALAHLQVSIAEKGVTDPLIVREITRQGALQGKYEIIDGERRYRAAKALGLESVPCIVKVIPDSEVFHLQLISHLQRQNIHPIEEAKAFLALAELPGQPQNVAEAIRKISASTGKPVHFIAQRMKLLDLVKEAQKLYAENVLTTDHVTLLARLTPEDQTKAIAFLVEEDFHEGNKAALSVKTLKAWIDDEISLNLKEAPFDKADAELIAGVPACIACPKNSGFNTALFPELNAKDVCQDRACFNAKVAAYMERRKAEVRKAEKKPFIMISTQERMDPDDPLKVEGVKMSGRFKVVKEGNECADTKVAEWIDGKEKGRRVLVCNYSKCSKHNKGAGRSTASPTNRNRNRSGDDWNSPVNVQKRRLAENNAAYNKARDREYRNAVISEIIKAGPQKLTTAFVREFVKGTIELNQLDSTRFILRTFGLGEEAKKGELTKILDKGGDLELITIMSYVMCDHFFDVWRMVQNGKEFEAFAKQNKVNVKSIRALSDGLFETKVHKCEHCHCSEVRACEGGCKWNSQFEAAGRHVCTKCVDKVKPLVQAKPAKLKKSA
jgi:ParB/RepB/Spo0J family partition protein